MSTNKHCRFSMICAMEPVKPMFILLSCLTNGKKDQFVRCDVEADGMLFAYHSKGKSLQIKTTIPRELFESFQYFSERDEFLSFALNLSSILEILSIFGANSVSTTSLQISYRENVSVFFVKLLKDIVQS
jgi:cell cycle checkpoint protein